MTPTPDGQKIKINLPNSNTFEILAKNYSKEHIYIQSLKLNGEAHTSSFFTHQELTTGGVLEFTMGVEANKNFASGVADRPKSEITESLICPPPTIISESQTFKDQALISMSTLLTDTKIFYTTDGSQPNKDSYEYSEPFKIRTTTGFKIRAFHADYGFSKTIESRFYKIDDSKSIELTNAYSPLYPAGGDMALVDQIRGNNNFKTGTWQGFHNTNIEAIITFKTKTKIEKISIGFIQEPGAWLFFPKKVSFFISDNKKDWILVGSEENTFDKKVSSPIHDFSIQVYPKRVKYIKIIAENSGPCPDWHLGAGGDTWLFCDEVVLE